MSAMFEKIVSSINDAYSPRFRTKYTRIYTSVSQSVRLLRRSSSNSHNITPVFHKKKQRKAIKFITYRPVVVMTMMAEAWQETAADVAAMAMVCAVSVGFTVTRCNSSKYFVWYTAASASLQIWNQREDVILRCDHRFLFIHWVVALNSEFRIEPFR